MKDKYYTPEIQEFHVGFEYEYLTIDNQWIKDIFGSIKPDDTEQMDFNIVKLIIEDSSEDIRVKYLDKADIEDLGWEYNKEDSKHNSWDDYSLNDLTLTVSFDDWRIHINNGEGYEDLESYFYGYIKNKGKLKEVMDMLRITVKKD